MARAPVSPERLVFRPRSAVLRGLEGELERTARRLDAVDPPPPATCDLGLHPVLRLLSTPRGGPLGGIGDARRERS